jgi:outer membrane receptor for ferrienterochelin and colicin
MKRRSNVFLSALIIILTVSPLLSVEDKISSNEKNSNKIIQDTLKEIISVNFQNVTMEEALLTVAEKGKFNLNFNRSRIPVQKIITFKMNKVSAFEVLKKILNETGTLLTVTSSGQLAVVPVKDHSPTPQKPKTGYIKGTVKDKETSDPLPGCYVQLENTSNEVVTDTNGNFILRNINPGIHKVLFTLPGFETLIKSGITVHPEQTATVKAKLDLSPIEATNVIVDVFGQYRTKNNPQSMYNLSAREVQRAPGTAGGVSRMLGTLPGVTFLSDTSTDMLVRGGSPTENGFYVDGLEIPNINHLPRLGSCGGVYSIINPNLIHNVDFYSGVFTSDYGDRLSSITDISLREGNRSEIKGNIDLSFLMAGLVLEGPITKGKGSWLFSVRRSHLNFLYDVGMVGEETRLDSVDSQMKLTYDFSPKQKLSLTNILSNGIYRDYYDDTIEDNTYEQNVLGLSWKAFWNESFFSKTSLSYAYLGRMDREAFPYNFRAYFWEATEQIRYFSFRTTNFLSFNKTHKLEFGFQIKHEKDEIDHYSKEWFGYDGIYHPEQEYDLEFHTTKYCLFLSHIWKFHTKWTLSTGLRGDYSSAHDVFHISPRLSISFQLSEKFSVNGSYGEFFQTIPMRFTTYYSQHIDLQDSNVSQFTLGMEYSINPSARICLEFYRKEYENLLLDPRYPQKLASELAVDTYYFPKTLINDIDGNTTGIELLVHKKLDRHFYGILSAAIFSSRFKDLWGATHKNEYDNGYILNLTAGYKPKSSWEFSLKWTFMGGRPHTPIDMDKSVEYNYLVYKNAQYNWKRYPAYNRLNLRIEKIFSFERFDLTFYLDIWNTFNRKNVYSYQWNPMIATVESENQLPFLPILGITLDF